MKIIVVRGRKAGPGEPTLGRHTDRVRWATEQTTVSGCLKKSLPIGCLIPHIEIQVVPATLESSLCGGHRVVSKRCHLKQTNTPRTVLYVLMLQKEVVSPLVLDAPSGPQEPSWWADIDKARSSGGEKTKFVGAAFPAMDYSRLAFAGLDLTDATFAEGATGMDLSGATMRLVVLKESVLKEPFVSKKSVLGAS